MNSSINLRSLVLAVSLMACQEIYAADEAKDAAANFYQNYHKLRQAGELSGIPNEAQLAQLSPLITPQLRKLFSAAYLEQQRCIEQYPEDKPPWIEGDIFSSNFEGFTSFKVGNSKAQARVRQEMMKQVPVKFIYIEGKYKMKWTDTLVLRNETGHWLVEDIFYHANFAFTSGFGKNLQSSLKSIPAC